ncbi:DUF177 domain-containing protein [Hyphomicrobium sp. 99]|uniref:YceD family protein n=1 Tax=Hyphomicrobium sp. 99 TaxID=1163419 RepID=UPI0005F88E62|nr:DUF177 domain-containing protein [Hyphomicrobium sp. 99]
MTDQLNWIEKSTDIPAGGLQREREATPAECQAIAQALDILKVGSLSTHYRINAIAGDGYRLRGTVVAVVEQACVVSLEPVSGNVNANYEVEFFPSVDAPEGEEEEASILGVADVELLEHGVIPVGRIVYETLSASLDPYPRRPDAEFNWQDPKAAEPEKVSPFAALSKLKTDR